MSRLDTPAIESFTPMKAYRATGQEYLRLQHDSGVTLDLSESGVLEVDQNPQMAALLERMGDFIAEHNGYRDDRAVSAAEPGGIPSVAERRSSYHRWRLASVYHHDSAPGAIIKAYDYDRKSAASQFYLGNWMYAGLEQADDGVYSAPQFAKFTAAAAFRPHQTVVMGYVPGEDLGTWAFSRRNAVMYEVSEVETAVRAVRSQIRQKIQTVLGWRGSTIINDLEARGNVILSKPDASLPEILDQDITIIDQPAVHRYGLPKILLARHMPVFGIDTEAAPTETSPANVL